MTNRENPPHDELADDEDELGWDRDQHGRMRDEAAPDDVVLTESYDPDDPDEAVG